MKLTNLRRYAVLGVIALAAAGCGDKEGADGAKVAKVEAPTTPTAAIDNAVRALRAGDLRALVTSQVPPKYMDKMKAEWKEDLAKDPPHVLNRSPKLVLERIRDDLPLLIRRCLTGNENQVADLRRGTEGKMRRVHVGRNGILNRRHNCHVKRAAERCQFDRDSEQF